MAVEIFCKKHPDYKAIYAPKVNCIGCEWLYYAILPADIFRKNRAPYKGWKDDTEMHVAKTT